MYLFNIDEYKSSFIYLNGIFSVIWHKFVLFTFIVLIASVKIKLN